MSDRLRYLIQSGAASEKQLEEAGRDFVLATKTAARSPQMRSHSGDVQEVGDRVLRFTVSDESTDRMGDIIRQDGWDLGNFKRNPVILWGHDGDTRPPVGRAVGVGHTVRAGLKSLEMDVEFAPKEAHPFADTVYQLSKSGYLKATSVGFLPLETKEYKTDEEAKAAGLGPYGVEYTKSEMLETSVVSVPANPNAVQDGLKRLVEEGRVGSDGAESFAKCYQVTERDLQRRIDRLSDARSDSLSEFFQANRKTIEDAIVSSIHPGPLTFEEDVQRFSWDATEYREASVPISSAWNLPEKEDGLESLIERLVCALEINTREVANLRRSLIPEVVRSHGATGYTAASLVKGLESGLERFREAFEKKDD